MMKLIRIQLFFLLAAALFSCEKKDFPETIVETKSDFYFNGTIDGEAISLKAGTNSYYMYSSFDHHGELYSFIANLRQSGCTSCTKSLKISINDFRNFALGEETKVDSSLFIGHYPLLGRPVYAVQFQSTFRALLPVIPNSREGD